MIPPGGQGKVVLEVDTEQQKGTIVKGLTISTNDTAWPEVQFRIKADVKSILQVSPEDTIRFSMKRGESLTRQLKLLSFFGEPFNITGVNSSSRYITLKHEPIEKSQGSSGGPGYTLTLAVSPEIPAGFIRETVKIETDLPGASQESLRIIGEVKGTVKYYPAHVGFHPDAATAEGLSANRVFLIRSKGNGFKIEKVQTHHKDLTWEVFPIKEGASYLLLLVWTGGECREVIEGKIEVTTNDHQMPRVVIPYKIHPHRGRE